LWSLLPKQHRDFFNKVTDHGSVELGQTVHHNTASYDPTENCGYHNPAADHPTILEIRAAAEDFFLGRPVDVIEGHGSDPGSYEFEFDFAIALETEL
jgi:hypothetical protein